VRPVPLYGVGHPTLLGGTPYLYEYARVPRCLGQTAGALGNFIDKQSPAWSQHLPETRRDEFYNVILSIPDIIRFTALGGFGEKKT
jgi:hypothetical protein